MPAERPRRRAQQSNRSSSSRRRDEDRVYHGATGFIIFGPDEAEAGDEIVRRIRVQDGPKLYSVTVWPSHEHIELAVGMFVGISGSYTKQENDDGTIWHNLSTNKLIVLGEDEGVRDDERPAPARKKTTKKAAPKRRAAAVEDDDDDDDDVADDDDDEDDEDDF